MTKKKNALVSKLIIKILSKPKSNHNQFLLKYFLISKGQSQSGAATNNTGPFQQTVLNVTEIKDVSNDDNL